MPGEQFLVKLGQYLFSPVAKRIFGALVLLLAVAWGWRRIQRAQEAVRRQTQQRQQQQQLPPGNARSQAPALQRAVSEVKAEQKSTPQHTPSTKYLTPGKQQRKVCISTETVVFSPGSLADPKLVDGIVPLLSSLVQCCSVFLITKVENDQMQEKVQAAFERSGLFDSGLKRHKLLFCSHTEGKIAMVRHIEPSLCVDDEIKVLTAIRPYIEDVIHISRDLALDARPVLLPQGLLSLPSLAMFFGQQQSSKPSTQPSSSVQHQQPQQEYKKEVIVPQQQTVAATTTNTSNAGSQQSPTGQPQITVAPPPMQRTVSAPD